MAREPVQHVHQLGALLTDTLIQGVGWQTERLPHTRPPIQLDSRVGADGRCASPSIRELLTQALGTADFESWHGKQASGAIGV